MSRGADADDDDEVQKKPLQFSAITATFEHRDENKTCSACRE